MKIILKKKPLNKHRISVHNHNQERKKANTHIADQLWLWLSNNFLMRFSMWIYLNAFDLIIENDDEDDTFQTMMSLDV